ncbi:MAG: SDR family oxidoreductase [Desulfobacteraceae bacterium]|nr:SDR family oxidoreductase [Desulfobacteraceae bacterium]
MSKKALVTGASKGIGKAVAIALAERGYDIGINYNRHGKAAEEVAETIRSLGQRPIALKADIGKKEEIDRMFDRFFEEFGAIDLLINNAGVSIFAPFLEVTEELWDMVTNIDWKGAYFCAQRAAKNMVKKGTRGVILNMSSNQKDGCWPTASVYGPTKMAVAKFTRNAAFELAHYGIRVVAIAPGYTDVGWPKDDPIQNARERIPLKRFAEPEEIAAVICRLVSDEFSYMTGTCLDIDGGALLPVVTENDNDASWSSTAID